MEYRRSQWIRDTLHRSSTNHPTGTPSASGVQRRGRAAQSTATRRAPPSTARNGPCSGRGGRCGRTGRDAHPRARSAVDTICRAQRMGYRARRRRVRQHGESTAPRCCATRRNHEKTCTVQSNSLRPVRLSGAGSGSIEPLDGDWSARWARAGAERLGSVPVTRWGRVRSARVVGPEAPTEPMGVVCAVRPEGEGLTHDGAARVGEWGAGS